MPVPLDPNSIDPLDLNGDHLVRMIGLEEGQHLDYKVQANISKDEDKREFLRDVVAMTNGGGGYLIYGAIDENDKCIGFRTLIMRKPFNRE